MTDLTWFLRCKFARFITDDRVLEKKNSKTPRQDDDILDKAYLSLFSNLRGSLPKLSSRLPSISELSNRVKRLLNHEATQVSRE